MFEYDVCGENDSLIFNKICNIIENEYPKTVRQKLLVDVDGSMIQTYTLNGYDIDVYDDYDIGAIYMKSEVDLRDLFEKIIYELKI